MSGSRVPRAHVDKLEQKLDGLVSLIKSTQQIAARDPDPPIIPASVGTRIEDHVVNPFKPLLPACVSSHCSPIEKPSIETKPRTAPDMSSSIIPTVLFAESQYMDPTSPVFCKFTSTARLDHFRNRLCLSFPFVVVPPSITVEELYLSRPFLYQSIIAVTSHKPDDQRELSRLFMKQVAERMFVNSERTLDLLLGILVFAGWFVDPFAQTYKAS